MNKKERRCAQAYYIDGRWLAAHKEPPYRVQGLVCCLSPLAGANMVAGYLNRAPIDKLSAKEERQQFCALDVVAEGAKG